MVSTNLDEVRQKIKAACQKANRNPNEVTLIAVSKTKPIELIEQAMENSQQDFGENKVQELTHKIEILPDNLRWHMIGHLQRNKVKYIVGKVALIHSVDSLRLAKEISKEAKKHGVDAEVLIEVNVGEEASKQGVTCTEAIALVEDIAKLPGVLIKGLMTIAPFVKDPEENRGIFRKLKQLGVDIKNKNINNVSVDVLSMGMTGDYEVAIEEGATMIRVGTGIFGDRDYAMTTQIGD